MNGFLDEELVFAVELDKQAFLPQRLQVVDCEADHVLFEHAAVKRSSQHVNVDEQLDCQLLSEDVLYRLFHADEQVLLAEG